MENSSTLSSTPKTTPSLGGELQEESWAEDWLGWKGDLQLLRGSLAWEEASKGVSCCLFASEEEGRAGKTQLPDLADLDQPRLAWGHLQLEYLLSQRPYGAAEGQRIRQGDSENSGLMKWWIVLLPSRYFEAQIIWKWRQNCSSSGEVKEELEVERSWFSMRRVRRLCRALRGRCCHLLSPSMGWPELSVSPAWHSTGMASPSSSPSQLGAVQNIPSVAALFQPLRLRQVWLNLIDYCSTNCIGSSPS